MKNRKFRSLYSSIKEQQITPEEAFWNRRAFLKKLGYLSAGLPLLGNNGLLNAQTKGNIFTTTEPLSSEYVITHHNNFYEFSTNKSRPAELATEFKPGNDWKVKVTGNVEKPGEYTLEDILSWVDIEERIYRLRCVEGWSMVVPWQGFQLSDLINRVKPSSNAKYIEFKTLQSRSTFPGQKRGALGFHVLPWPYKEGLRMDEAMNPLTFIATGVYGKNLPGQNGAPLRLVVPWKYGFKSIKSVVSIRFLEQRPTNTWHKSAPREYGFFANVNPAVAHPRWSQANERRITDESFFGVKRIPTQLFNGYQDQVAPMYVGMDLVREF
ncbi:MAG: protein-methionine-sulfoxide reductase catalytic subunit MsrP [Kangiellaceae bacterium]|nr:protein-methionine-sulfoxide reductase catalytic subunit MsrP [Kangiellaceae bacterium]